MTRHRRPETPPPEQPLFAGAELLWQLPSIAFTSWWNLMSGAWLPSPPHPIDHEDCEHEQLIVPEPLEEADERALFA